MKKTIAILTLMIMFFPAVSHAQQGMGSSSIDASLHLTASVGASAMMIASPVLVLTSATASVAANAIILEVTTDKGKTETIVVPAEVAEKANLQPGDTLATEPSETGALLTKNGEPVVYLVNPENASLSRSRELVK